MLPRQPADNEAVWTAMYQYFNLCALTLLFGFSVKWYSELLLYDLIKGRNVGTGKGTDTLTPEGLLPKAELNMCLNLTTS